MDFLTEEFLNEHLDECLAIVKEKMSDYRLEDDELETLTKEIMLTAQMAGGDFDLGNIDFYCEEYKKKNFLSRFKRMHDAFY